jgi:thiosulfate dehydrogenase
MMSKRSSWMLLAAAGCLGVGVWITVPSPPGPALAHKEPHTQEQLKTFEMLFMEQVKIGDLLWHGDTATQQRLRVKLSNTGWACAMCHPFASDTHPAQFPKWQEQMSKFATLRDMINWCIEKPNQGEVIDTDGQAMKALEAYITWSNRNSPLDPGRH